MGKKILIFDFDGVISDSLVAAQCVYNDLCGKYGCNVISDREEFSHLFDRGALDILKHLGIPFWKMPFAYFSFRKELKFHKRDFRLVKGMKEVLKVLVKKYECVIVTSNLSGFVEDFLKEHKISGIKEVIGADDNLSSVKKIKEVREKYKGSEYYYIGDLRKNMVDGKKAGVRTVAVSWGYQSRKWILKAKPDFIVDSPKGLVELFD